MKNILLLVHDDLGQESRLQAALDITRALDGHLSCLELLVPPVSLTYDPYMGMAAGELIAMVGEQEDKNRARLSARLATEDVAWSWNEAVGFPAGTVIEQSMLADLVVLSSSLDQGQSPEVAKIAGTIVSRVNRPVLAVPKNSGGFVTSGPVVIAWDGSREADAALREAVPLLKLSANVILLAIDEPDGAFAAAPAAAYLSRHGVLAEIETVQRADGDLVYTTILDRAHELGAGYIVMGAYGHSPMAEAIFGGVTRSMLAHSDLPLFLAH